MARRGDILREHILCTAKNVFIELGFERTSMDVVAGRAQTSKRTLYAYFESKEKLFLAVIELVRCLFLSRLKMPGEYAAEPQDSLVLFCARYAEILFYQASIQMIRVSVAESERFPEQAANYFDVMFTEVHGRLSAYLSTTFALSERSGNEASHRLLGRILYPRLTQALFGMERLAPSFDPETLSPDFDLEPIREAVGEMLASLREK